MADELTGPNPRCSRCGGPHPFDTVLPSIVWNRVIRGNNLPDYLCLTCIITVFASQGESFTAELIGGPFPGGVPIEIQIRSQTATDAAQTSEEDTRLRAILDARGLEIAALGAKLVDKIDALKADVVRLTEEWDRWLRTLQRRTIRFGNVEDEYQAEAE